MEKSLETASAAPNDRPATMNESVVSQEPENTQLDVHRPVGPDRVDESDIQYVTGIRLATIISAVTLTAFLMTLDVSIIATVNRLHWLACPVVRVLTLSKRQSLKSRASFILFRMLGGTGVLIC